MSNPAAAPREVVRNFLDAMEKMDFPTALALVADDCEYTNGPLGTFTGPAGVKAALEPFFTPIERNEFIIKREATVGATVFIERLDRHLLQGRWIELPVTGVLEVKDGRINVWHEYFDVATLQAQMTGG